MVSLGFAMKFPEEVLLAAGRSILNGSSLAVTEIEDISRVSSGDHWEKRIVPYVGTDDFSWPWFDEWRAVFLEQGRWPQICSWWEFEQIELSAKLSRRMLQTKREMLMRSISSRAYNIVRFRQILETLSEQRKGKLAYQWHPIISPGEDVVARRIARKMSKNEMSEGSLPPFFPGDSTVVGLRRSGN